MTACTPTPDILRRLGVADAAGWSPVLTKACADNSITTRNTLSGFLANVLHETGNLRVLVENLNYSSDALLQMFPSHFNEDTAERYGRTGEHPADQHAIAEQCYGGRYGNGPSGSGDGWLYRGHGGMQTTFKANYISLSKMTGLPLLGLPALLETREGAAQSAAIFWKNAGCNPIAEAGGITRCRAIVNGGTNGLPEVKALWSKALGIIH